MLSQSLLSDFARLAKAYTMRIDAIDHLVTQLLYT